MRRSVLMLAAAAAALFIAAPDVSAQNATIAQLKGSYTPVGQLPAGTYGVTAAAMPVSFVVDLRAKSPSGYILSTHSGAETRHDFEFYNPSSYTGTRAVDVMSLWFDEGDDHPVACTLARREANRFSGLCKDQAGREGWMEVMGRQGESLEPGKWYGPM